MGNIHATPQRPPETPLSDLVVNGSVSQPNVQPAQQQNQNQQLQSQTRRTLFSLKERHIRMIAFGWAHLYPRQLIEKVLPSGQVCFIYPVKSLPLQVPVRCLLRMFSWGL